MWQVGHSAARILGGSIQMAQCPGYVVSTASFQHLIVFVVTPSMKLHVVESLQIADNYLEHHIALPKVTDSFQSHGLR